MAESGIVSALRRSRRAAVALLACLAAAGPALALDSGTTPHGARYASGGVSDAEQRELQSQRDQYSLWVVTAARRSGLYLADARVRIVDAQQRVVFDGALAGPWLMIDLPLGRYTIVASRQGDSRQQATTIHRGDHHQAVFYFDVAEE